MKEVGKMKEETSDCGKLIVVAGAGGFIGGHLVQYLIEKGFSQIRAIGIKPLDDWYQRHDVENHQLDLSEKQSSYLATRDAAYVFNLAADMGGMGFIETH